MLRRVSDFFTASGKLIMPIVHRGNCRSVSCSDKNSFGASLRDTPFDRGEIPEKCGKLYNEHMSVRFEVFTAVTMNNDVFWDVTPCCSCKNRRFGGI
jgi:hypothetical protein